MVGKFWTMVLEKIGKTRNLKLVEENRGEEEEKNIW